MPVSTRPGWEYNSDGKLEATFRQNVKGLEGARDFKNNIVVVANASTGGYDAYYDNRSALGISFGRTALYSFNPNTGRITPYENNRELFDRVYPGGITDPQLQALNKDTKNGVIENLRLNATDPIDQANLKKIRELEGYKTQSNTLPISDPNDKTKPDSGDSDGSGADDNVNDNDKTEPQIGLPKALENVQEREYKTNMRYPIDLVDSFQDYLKIQMVKYKPRGLANADGSFALPSRPNTPAGDRQILSTIFLPIPGGISDNNNVDWSKADMGMLSSALGNIAMSAFEGGDALKKTAESQIGAVQNNISGIKIAATKKIIENIAGVDPLKRSLGAVINTNAELLFNGPNLRQFSFTYKFSPRSDDEAKEVRNIIRTLKQGMSAKKANNFLFIKSPHTFFLSYQHRNQDHPFLNKFKECALTALSVNYTPDGNYATYYDGSMISYQVTMSFQELEPVFDDDYEGGAGGDQNETSIGF
jgi:hypothetical protein